MSGFEIVGVILGSLPLLISALESYADGVSTINDMVDYQDVFVDLNSAFTTAMAIYRQSCEELLGQLSLPHDLFSKLVENSDESAWKDPDLIRSLQEKLQDDYRTYKSATKSLNKKIKLFAKKLKLNDTTLKPVWVTADGDINKEQQRKFFKNPWRRIKGGFEEGRYLALFVEIDADINRIAKLTKGAMELGPVRAERNFGTKSTHWTNIRHQAKRLFHTLDSKWSCTCQNQHPRSANLRLDMRKEADILKPSQRFGLVLALSGGTGFVKPLAWDWRRVEIELLQTSELTVSYNSARPSITIKDVSELSPSRVVSTSRIQPRKINDLCTLLKSDIHDGCCIGFLDDNPWEHHIYPSTQPNFDPATTKPTSLKEILGQKHLGIKQKCLLALTLASAVLQLHDTPWLRDDWSLGDIYFMVNDLEDIPVFEQPYVSRSFTSVAASPEPVSERHQMMIKNRIIFGLGVALIELSYGKPLLEFKKDTDDEPPGFTEFFIAKRLANKIHNYESPKYADVVIRCIDFNFGIVVPENSLDQKELQEAFYKSVAVPLQQNYELFTNG